MSYSYFLNILFNLSSKNNLNFPSRMKKLISPWVCVIKFILAIRNKECLFAPKWIKIGYVKMKSMPSSLLKIALNFSNQIKILEIRFSLNFYKKMKNLWLYSFEKIFNQVSIFNRIVVDDIIKRCRTVIVWSDVQLNYYFLSMIKQNFFRIYHDLSDAQFNLLSSS